MRGNEAILGAARDGPKEKGRISQREAALLVFVRQAMPWLK